MIRYTYSAALILDSLPQALPVSLPHPAQAQALLEVLQLLVPLGALPEGAWRERLG